MSGGKTMYIPHELTPHQERYADVFAAQLKAVRTIADLFPGMCPPPEPPAGVREPRRPLPTRDIGAVALDLPKGETILANTILIMR